MGFFSSLFGAASGMFARTATDDPAPVSPVILIPPAPAAKPEEEAGIEEATTMAAGFEGEVLHPYQDSVGVWTIADGATRGLDGNPVTAATPPITHAQAVWLLQRDVREAAVQADAAVTVKLNANQWAAIIDFIFNLGDGNFRSSTLHADVNAGNFAAAADEFEKWDHAGGKVLAGLLRRRLAEKTAFTTPV